MGFDTIIWFALLLVFLVVEAACPIHLVSIWFSAGSLVAMIASYMGAGLPLQLVLFLAVSVTLLLLLWPFVKGFIKPRLAKTNVDAVIGTEGYVTTDIDNIIATGQVKLNGMEWTARSTYGQAIPKGTLVKVDRVEGVKVFVTPVMTPVGTNISY